MNVPMSVIHSSYVTHIFFSRLFYGFDYSPFNVSPSLSLRLSVSLPFPLFLSDRRRQGYFQYIENYESYKISIQAHFQFLDKNERERERERESKNKEKKRKKRNVR